MITLESQKKQLARGLVFLGADFVCKYGARGHSVAKVFGKYCDTGAKRIWDLRKEWECYLISDQFDNNPEAKYYSLEPAYEYIRKTKRYKLNPAFFHWLQFSYLKGGKK